MTSGSCCDEIRVAFLGLELESEAAQVALRFGDGGDADLGLSHSAPN